MAIEKFVEAGLAKLSGMMASEAPDVTGLRDAIERHAARLAEGEGDRFDDPWLTRADANTVGFSPTTADGQPLLVNGKSTTFWPLADFPTAIAAFRDAVARGDLDDQLVSGGQPTVSPKIEGEQIPADLTSGALSTGGGRTDANEVETRFTENLDNRLAARE